MTVVWTRVRGGHSGTLHGWWHSVDCRRTAFPFCGPHTRMGIPGGPQRLLWRQMDHQRIAADPMRMAGRRVRAASGLRLVCGVMWSNQPARAAVCSLSCPRRPLESRVTSPHDHIYIYSARFPPSAFFANTRIPRWKSGKKHVSRGPQLAGALAPHTPHFVGPRPHLRNRTGAPLPTNPGE